MNVFLIPSWYPDPERILNNGVFCLEQAQALAALQNDLHIHVSLWGQSEYRISPRGLRLALKKPLRWLRGLKGFERSNDRFYETCRPVLNWPFQVLHGNLRSVLKANRENFLSIQKRFGKIDVIHAHVSFPGGFVGMELAKEFGKPLVITEHMSPFPFLHFETHETVSHFVMEPMRFANRVIAVSPSLKNDIQRKIGVDAVVIPNMVDDALFKTCEQNANSDQFSFFTLGALTPQKGIGDLLRAIAQLRSPAKFRIGGAGSLEPYRKLATQLGVQDRVEWLGALSRERVREEMQRCNAFVLTSHHETFGVVYVEALASGKPVIATRCGGPESIVNQNNGILVLVGDIAAITNALDKMIRIARDFSPNALRADALQRFSKQSVTTQIASVYRDVIEDK